MPDATKKHRQNEQKSNGRKGFQQVLEEARQQSEHNNMEGKTIGYTRNGQVYIGEVMQRTYF